MHSPTYVYAYSRNLEKYIGFFFNFRKAFLSLNRDKYFTLYWCFVLGFPLSHTLVETFDQANSNSIPASICHGL